MEFKFWNRGKKRVNRSNYIVRGEGMPTEREMLSAMTQSSRTPRLIVGSLEGPSVPFDRSVMAQRALENLRGESRPEPFLVVSDGGEPLPRFTPRMAQIVTERAERAAERGVRITPEVRDLGEFTVSVSYK